MKYASVAGVAWGVITNGDTWLFVRCLELGDVMKRIFARVTISSDPPDQVAATLRHIEEPRMHEHDLTLLWKIGVVDHEVSRLATEMFHRPNRKLAMLLAKELGGKYPPKEIAESLGRLDVTIRSLDPTTLDREPSVANPAVSPPGMNSAKRLTKRSPDRSVKRSRPNSASEIMTLTLDDPWKFTRPVSFTHPFTDEEIAVERGGWQFVYLEICRALHQRDCGLFHSLLTNPLFLRHIQMGRDGFRNPHPIVDGIFAEMNVSSRGIRARIRKLMQTFSHHAPQFFSAQAVRVDTNGEKQG